MPFHGSKPIDKILDGLIDVIGFFRKDKMGPPSDDINYAEN